MIEWGPYYVADNGRQARLGVEITWVSDRKVELTYHLQELEPPMGVRTRPCTCPDPYCEEHARCIFGHKLIITPGDPAFCPGCGHDVTPQGACSSQQE